jgi:outer membrane receptor protein involved in Fe transport
LAPATTPDRLAYTKSAVNGTRFENFPLGSRVSFTYEDLFVLNEGTGRAVGFGISAGQDRTASSESGQKIGVINAISSLGATTGNLSDVTGFKANEYIESEIETRLGVLASAGFAFNKNHQIGASFFWSQIGSDNHNREFNGFEMSGGSLTNLTDSLTALKTDPTTLDFGSVNIDNSFGLMGKDEIYYRQRSLYDAQIKGEHKFEGSIPAEVTWALANINARQDEPDFYAIPYQYNPAKTLYRGSFGGGEGRYARYWRDTEESTLAGRVDGKFQFENEKIVDTDLSTGYYFDRSNRDYNEASYQLSSGSVNGASLENFFSNLSNYSGNILIPGAATPTFATGERTLDAVYGSALFTLVKDKPKIKKLDLLIGARFEAYNMESSGRGAIGNSGSSDFYQQLDLAEGGSGAGFVPGAVYTGTIDEDKILPAAGLNYSPVTGFNVRLSASQTTARPSFREMGSYFTVDQVLDENVHGNSNLKTSDVTNYDLRFEYFFPESTDLVAFSVFKKDVKSPIERVSVDVTSIGSVSTWRNNANDAEVLGAEVEFAKNLKFLGGPGEYFTLGANYTYLAATVDRDPAFEAAQIAATGIEDSRPLYDQPAFIANAYITYDYRPWKLSTTLSYFAIGDVLQKVNRSTWDTYVAASDRFDATIVKKIGKNFSIRASARNLLDPTREFIADPDATSGKVVLRSFRDGRSYTITGVYEF